jgi:hypothetical protein
MNIPLVAVSVAGATILVALLELVSRVLLNWRAERWMAETTRKIEAGELDGASLEDRKYGTIILGEEELTVSGRRNSKVVVPWEEIRQIAGYKRDLLTTDLICLAVVFEGATERMVLDLHEEMAGFRALLDELERRFPFPDSKWWSKVAFPAFAKNWTVLWSSEEAQQAAGAYR